MKAFKLVCAGIAILTYAILLTTKPIIDAAKKLPAVSRLGQQDSMWQNNRQALLTSPLRSLARLPF